MEEKKREELQNWRELFRFVMLALLGVVSWSFLDFRSRGMDGWNLVGWIRVLVLAIIALGVWRKMEVLIREEDNES